MFLTYLSILLLTEEELPSNVGYVEQLAVHKMYRNQGVGEALLKYGEQFLKSLSYKNIYALNVAKTNIKAIRFYQRLDFKVQKKVASLLTRIFVGEGNWLYMIKRIK